MQSLQSQLEQVQTDLLNERANGQQKDQDRINQLESQEASLLRQIMEEANQQAHAGRVQEATTEITTYFDTLYVGGQTMRELCSDEEAYQILRLSVSQAFIDQATKNSEILQKVQDGAANATKQANDSVSNYEKQNLTLVQENHRLNLELDDMTSRFNAVNLLLSEAPSDEETEKLKQEVADLKAQLALKAKADEPKGDAKSQIDAIAQERENKKVKVTNLRLADPYGINTKDYLATDALTGTELAIHSNYIHSYKEITAEEAEQIRADEVNKKAQEEAIQAAIPTLETPAIPFVNEDTRQDEATTDKAPNETNQVDANAAGENQTEQGNQTLHAMVEQTESEVITLESLQAQINKINSHLGMVA